MLSRVVYWAADATDAAAPQAVPERTLPMWMPYAVIAGVLLLIALLIGLLMLRRRPQKVVYRGGIPDIMSRRHLLYEEEVASEQKVSIGEEYLRDDRIEDALEFFGYGGDREGLIQIKKRAEESGFSYLLERVAEFMPDLVSEQDWERLARAAERKGLHQDAARARQILRGDEEEEESAEEDGETPGNG